MSFGDITKFQRAVLETWHDQLGKAHWALGEVYRDSKATGNARYSISCIVAAQENISLARRELRDLLDQLDDDK